MIDAAFNSVLGSQLLFLHPTMQGRYSGVADWSMHGTAQFSGLPRVLSCTYARGQIKRTLLGTDPGSSWPKGIPQRSDQADLARD